MVTTEDGRAIPVQLTTAEGHPISTGFPGADVSVPTSHLQVGADLGAKGLACVGDGLIVVRNASCCYLFSISSFRPFNGLTIF